MEAALNKLLDPIRQEFENDVEFQKIEALAYPPVVAEKKKKKEKKIGAGYVPKDKKAAVEKAAAVAEGTTKPEDAPSSDQLDDAPAIRIRQNAAIKHKTRQGEMAYLACARPQTDSARESASTAPSSMATSRSPSTRPTARAACPSTTPTSGQSA